MKYRRFAHHVINMLFILLTVLSLTPRFIYGDSVRPSRVNADVGLSVVLPCDAKNSKDVMWEFETKEDSKIPKELASSGIVFNGGTKRYTLLPSSRGLHNLMINKTQLTDAGIYICTENNGAGTKHYVVLIVNGNGFKSRTIAVGSGSPAVLPCDPETNADVKWEFEDTSNHTLIELASKGKFIDGHDERFMFAPSANGNHSLRISITQPRDAGLYICTEDNGDETKHYVILKINENVCEPPSNSSQINTSITAAVIVVLIVVIAILALLLKVRNILKFYQTSDLRQEPISPKDMLFCCLPIELCEIILKKAATSLHVQLLLQTTDSDTYPDIKAVKTICSINSESNALILKRKFNVMQLRETFKRLRFPCPRRLPKPIHLVGENNDNNSFTILGRYIYTVQGSRRTELKVFDVVNDEELLKQTLDAVKQPTSSVGSQANDCIYLGDSISRCIWSMTSWKPEKTCELKHFYSIPTRHIVKSLSAADDGRLIVLIAIEEFSGKTWRGVLVILDEDGKPLKRISIFEDIVNPSSVAFTENNTFAISGVKKIWLIGEDGYKVSKLATFSNGIELPCSVRYIPDNRTLFVADSASGEVLLLAIRSEKLVLRKVVKKWDEYRTIQANRSFVVNECVPLIGDEGKDHATLNDSLIGERNVRTVRFVVSCPDDGVSQQLPVHGANFDVPYDVSRDVERYQKRPVRVVGDSDKLIVGLNSGEILAYRLR